MLLPNGKKKNIPLNINNPLKRHLCTSNQHQSISSSEENRATCEYCVMQHDPRKPHITPHLTSIQPSLFSNQQPHLNPAISKSVLFLGSSCVVMIHPPELRAFGGPTFLPVKSCKVLIIGPKDLILDGTRKTPRHFLDPRENRPLKKISCVEAFPIRWASRCQRDKTKALKMLSFVAIHHEDKWVELLRVAPISPELWLLLAIAKGYLGRILSGKLELQYIIFIKSRGAAGLLNDFEWFLEGFDIKEGPCG